MSECCAVANADCIATFDDISLCRFNKFTGFTVEDVVHSVRCAGIVVAVEHINVVLDGDDGVEHAVVLHCHEHVFCLFVCPNARCHCIFKCGCVQVHFGCLDVVFAVGVEYTVACVNCIFGTDFAVNGKLSCCVAHLDVCIFKCRVVVADEVAVVEDMVVCKVRIDDDAVLIRSVVCVEVLNCAKVDC